MAEIESVRLSESPADTNLPEPTRAQKATIAFQEYLDKEKIKLQIGTPWASLQQYLLASLDFSQNSTDKVKDIAQSTFTSGQNQGGQSSAAQPAEKTSNQSSQAQPAASAQTQTVSPTDLKHLLAEFFPGYGAGAVNPYSQLFDSLMKDSSQVSLDGVIDEIVKQVTLVKEKGKAELSIELKPENLGTLQLLVSSTDGKINVQIVASTESKQYLDDHMAELQAALQNAQINVGNLNVSVGNFSQNRSFGNAEKEFSLSYSLFGENMVQKSQNDVPVVDRNFILPASWRSNLFLEV